MSSGMRSERSKPSPPRPASMKNNVACLKKKKAPASGAIDADQIAPVAAGPIARAKQPADCAIPFTAPTWVRGQALLVMRKLVVNAAPRAAPRIVSSPAMMPMGRKG
eukprot:TRINITY_DN14479_c0_g1_i1.p3 TRINITY_DN14479_c0_g1~~TRINITY_DN14479_c0_g1_i1.p3  ORF type:complete len:107 (-),score=5.83 TRINITY_DN14479_c0_g1_i1:676-996(-)